MDQNYFRSMNCWNYPSFDKKERLRDKPSYEYAPCYKTHPPLKIDGWEIYGGNCSVPVVTDADIYVGLDYSMSDNKRSYPWEEGEWFYFPIPDGGVAANTKDFMQLITYLEDNLKVGKKIHVGCIGGHGRTGMVLSALYAQVTGSKDAIQYVRANYCKKAVESHSQIEFLIKNYNCSPTNPSKAYKTKPLPPKEVASRAVSSTKSTTPYQLLKNSSFYSDPKAKSTIWENGVKTRSTVRTYLTFD